MIWQPLNREIVTPDILPLLFIERDGVLFWRHRTDCYFSNAKARDRFNATLAQTECRTSDRRGYLAVAIAGVRYAVHRIVWALHHGAWPAQCIDHINRDRTDNRISNLRDVPPRLNSRNRKVQRGTVSGVTGVTWNASAGRWSARIRVNGGVQLNKYFERMEDAIAARRAAEVHHGFLTQVGA